MMLTFLMMRALSSVGSSRTSVLVVPFALFSDLALALKVPMSILSASAFTSFSLANSRNKMSYISSVSFAFGFSSMSKFFFLSKVVIVPMETLNSPAAFPKRGIFLFSSDILYY